MKRIKIITAASTLAVVAAVAAPAVSMAANNGNAQACQQGGWQTLVRSDMTPFANQDACVQYGAQAGSVYHLENFSEFKVGDQPTSFSGGTIDPSDYAPGNTIPNGGWGGSILAAGPYFNGFASGSHFLFTGLPKDSATFKFNSPAKSVQVQAESDKTYINATLTLTAYDAAGNVVGVPATQTVFATGTETVTLKAMSSSSNIDHFTVTNDDGGNHYGLGVSNIVWS
jgi:hypothetical protein